MVGCSDKYNGAIPWYMVRSSWPNFSEEDVDNCLPEEQSEVVDEMTEPCWLFHRHCKISPRQQSQMPLERKASARMMVGGDKSCLLLRMMNMVGGKSNLIERLQRHDLVLSSQSISHPNDDHIALDVVNTWSTSTSSGFRTGSGLASSRQEVEAHHARWPGFSPMKQCASK